MADILTSFISFKSMTLVFTLAELSLPIWTLILLSSSILYKGSQSHLMQIWDNYGLLLELYLMYSTLLVAVAQYLIGLPIDFFFLWAAGIQYPFSEAQLIQSPIVNEIISGFYWYLDTTSIISALLLALAIVGFLPQQNSGTDTLLLVSVFSWTLVDVLQYGSLISFSQYIN